ncbi:MAG: transposase [Acidimicrobiia bacterium]|nr:transposase [Acidimicrobiia bacterium]
MWKSAGWGVFSDSIPSSKSHPNQWTCHYARGESETLDAVWEAVRHRIPVPEVDHPLGCHRRRVADRICSRGIVIRLVTGCSWEVAEWSLDGQVSDTTLRTRRDEWVRSRDLR